MPIARLTKDSAFAPEEIRLMTAAFEAACRTLGASEPNHPRRDIIAKKIFEAAQAGERNSERLRECGVRAVS